jgi:tetratricopeptide (TPR) repeat protein
MSVDRYGLEMSGSPRALAHYDSALSHLLRFQPEVVAEAEASYADDPGCVMGRALRAYIGLMSSEWPDTKAAGELAAGVSGANDRERAHLRAIGLWVAGDLHAAGRVLDGVLAAHPRDALALAVGHQVDFFTGDARGLRMRVERARAGWDASHPDAAFVDGMWAFGLEEGGDYGRSEEAGLRAVERNADDVWGIHAVVHTYEMQGRVGAGIRYLEERRKSWMEGTFFNVHNAWHLAIYLLEREDYAGALRIYDETLHHAASPGVAMEMLDAASLLWRLHLDGVDSGSRFATLADAWAAKDETPWYVFNDLHAIMALVGAGRQADAEAVVRRLRAFARDGQGAPSNRVMVSAAGLATAEALAAFGRGDYAAAVAHLFPVRHHLSVFGGSHAQRDAYQRTLLEAALRGGERALAAALVEERLEARPASSWAWGRLARLQRQAGDESAAARSDARRTQEIERLRGETAR